MKQKLLSMLDKLDTSSGSKQTLSIESENQVLRQQALAESSREDLNEEMELLKGKMRDLETENEFLRKQKVHRVLVKIVSADANATPGLGKYPPFKREVLAIATAALEGFKNEAKNMVVTLLDMERAFVPQHIEFSTQKSVENFHPRDAKKHREIST